MKKLTAILLTATMLLSLMAGTVAEDSRSQYADIADALAVLRALVGLENDACVTTHDFNENDVLDIGDALLVLRGLVGLNEMMVIRTGEVSEVVESSATTRVTESTSEVSESSEATRVTERTTEATTTTEVTTTEPPVEPPETLSDEMRERIKADWVEMFDFANYYSFGVPKGNTNIENVVIDEYFGTFNDGVVLMISYDYESHSDNTWIGIISGFRFRFVSSQSIIVWFNGDFYGFTSAFENEILTKQNIEQIYFRHRKAFSNVYACDDFLDTEEYYKW